MQGGKGSPRCSAALQHAAPRRGWNTRNEAQPDARWAWLLKHAHKCWGSVQTASTHACHLQVVQVQHRGQSPKLQGCLLVLPTLHRRRHGAGTDFLLFATPNSPSRYHACGAWAACYSQAPAHCSMCSLLCSVRRNLPLNTADMIDRMHVLRNETEGCDSVLALQRHLFQQFMMVGAHNMSATSTNHAHDSMTQGACSWYCLSFYCTRNEHIRCFSGGTMQNFCEWALPATWKRCGKECNVGLTPCLRRHGRGFAAGVHGGPGAGREAAEPLAAPHAGALASHGRRALVAGAPP